MTDSTEKTQRDRPMTTKENAQQKLRAFTEAAAELLEAMEQHEHATGEPFGTEAYPFTASFDDLLHDIIDWRDAHVPLYRHVSLYRTHAEETAPPERR